MNCRKAKKWLPLYSGGDLPVRKSRQLESHIQNCDTCRRDLQSYQLSLETARELLDRSTVPGSRFAWDSAIARALATASVSRERFSFKPIWIYAAMGTLAAVLTFLVVKPLPDQDTFSLKPAAAVSGSQDVVSMTLVSRESGLKVVWFLNRNFSLKEESE